MKLFIDDVKIYRSKCKTVKVVMDNEQEHSCMVQVENDSSIRFSMARKEGNGVRGKPFIQGYLDLEKKELRLRIDGEEIVKEIDV